MDRAKGERTNLLKRAWASLWGFRIEALTLAMLGATLAVVYWQDALLTRSIVVEPGNARGYTITTFDDSTQQGNSTAALDPRRPLAWRCTLRGAYDYPFCGFEILFDGEHYARGIDLSNYRNITLDIAYEGPATSLRMHLKNHDPRYSRVGRIETAKFNRAEFAVRQGLQRVTLSLDDFGVAEWWLQNNHIPPELSQPQFDNIVSLDIQTGAGAPQGRHAFRIQRLTLEGRLLSPAELYRALLLCWLAFLAAAVAYRISRLKKDLAARRRIEENARLRAAEAEAAVAELEAAQQSLIAAQAAAERNADRVREVLENTSDCVFSLNKAWQFTYLNERARAHFEGRDLVGQSILDVLPGIQESSFAALFATAMATREPASAEGCLASTGAWYELSVVPNDRELTVFFRDISGRKQSEERVRWLANHDSLTGLPNRLLFQERIDALLAAGKTAAPFALLVVDLDEFKRVNDTLGHDAGDQLLCAFASRLREATRPEDLVARLGGDEFAVILKDIQAAADVEAAVARIYRALRQPHVFAGKVLDCNASIGASLFPRHGPGKAQLMKHADIAVYAAKAAGRGNLKIFEPQMRAELQSRMSMLRLARKALKEDRIVPFYQPKVDLTTGAVLGFEALLRWHGRGRSMQAPDRIAAAFEDLTLAAEISDRMIERVIADMARWREEGVAFGHVAVNAAAAEFRRGDFAAQLLARLEAAGLAPASMQIEVTETVFLGRGADYVERALKALNAAGVRIALDDFGTGYASLSHLKQFPVDILKIDRSFVADLQSDGAAAIVSAVVNLGKSLGIEVVAEGIERIEQEMHLKSLGCPQGQGFFYSVPVPAAELPALVRARGERRAA